MAITPVNVGSAPNDGTGDSLRAAFQKLNANDSELDGRVTSASSTASAAQSTANAAQTTANNAIPASQKGTTNGVATLDSSGKVPKIQISLTADDVGADPVGAGVAAAAALEADLSIVAKSGSYDDLIDAPASSAFGKSLLTATDARAARTTLDALGDFNKNSIEFGDDSTAGARYIDFHSGGSSIDYDSRIIASGGSATVGQGTLAYTAASHTFSGIIIPGSTTGIKGTTTNNNAQAGSIGEVISAQVLEVNKVNLSTGNAVTLMSITLTPGHWDLNGQGAFSFLASGITVTRVGFSFGTVTNSLNVDNLFYNSTLSFTSGSAGTFMQASLLSPPIKISANTTYYMVFVSGFTGGTVAAYGSMTATRVR